MPERWRPPPSELALGLGFYATATPPTRGVLKADDADFRVQEISSYPRPDPEGTFVVLRVRSKGWEQHELAAELGRRLGLPRNAIAWSGTKDRHAVAERLFSYRGALPDRPVDLAGVEVLESYRARDGLVLGHHYGNGFEIRVTGLDATEAPMERLSRALAALRETGGVPDFFGPQRFGEVRPITHLVGRALVAGDVEGAVELYLAGLPELSDPEGRAARAAYAATHDARRALAEFPRAYRFERLLLERLARGDSARAALRALSRELRLLFVHAAQSWMFNLWLTRRHESGISLVEPEPGDTLLRMAADGTTPSRDPVPVGPGNVAECRETVRRGRARLAGPLIGYATPRPVGRPGELFDRVLAESGSSPGGFRLPSLPEIASAGAWRPATIPAPPVGLRADGPDAAVLAFALPKGSYATVLIRELLKPGAVLETGPLGDVPLASNGRF